MPRSQTPVVSCTLALSRPGLLPSGHCTPSAFPRYRLRNILWTTTLHISGFHHAAYILVPSSFVLPWLGVHVDVTPDLLARLWSGGICTSPVRTHWVTITNFMGSLPIPRFRVYLGTSSALLGRYLCTGTKQLKRIDQLLYIARDFVFVERINDPSICERDAVDLLEMFT